MPGKITDSQIEESYLNAKAVFDGGMTLSDAITDLVSNSSMNKSSATDYIRNFQQMMNGMEYQRTLNLQATEYFLESILKDYGEKYLWLALGAVQKHLDYYEGIGKSKQRSIREIVGRYWGKVTIESSVEDYLDSFSDEVSLSLRDSREKRQLRLSTAKKTPETVSVQATVYRRNPDVVAEALSRANGVCEQCNNPAPFNKAKDGTPYLEVHHIKQLAKGGEDTLENTIAVCPNCHRKLHFG